MKNKDHISVCICTYRRPRLLARLLKELKNQQTNGLFTYSIVVVDNDHNQSAKEIVSSFEKDSSVAIHYDIEPEQNIALARNRAVRNAVGNLIAFIDDDEFPVHNWMLNLYNTLNNYGANGVLGPVKPYFESEPPQWIIKGRLADRETFETGTITRNKKYTRTGNVMLRKNIFNEEENFFNHVFGLTGGEDVDFFDRMIGKGNIFVWCDEAPVVESVPPERCKRSYFLKRALLRGLVNSKNVNLASIETLKSIIAITIYSSALPIFFLTGHHVFMKYLIRNCDHLGKVLGILNLPIIRERTF